MHYPKFKYHRTLGPKIVHTAHQEATLGSDWHDSPADFGVETCPGRKPDPAIAARRELAAAAPKAPTEKPAEKAPKARAAGAK